MEPTPGASAVHIVDPGDERLTDYRSLISAAARRRFEAAAGLYVAEGVPLVARLLERGHPARSILATPQAIARLGRIRAPSQTMVYAASPDLISSVVGFDYRRGAIGSFARPPLNPALEVIEASHSLALVEGVNDAENLGSILRAAAALGIDGVLLDPTTTDPFYRRCIRVSMGAAVEIPIAIAHPWPAVLGTLSAAGFTLVALSTKQAAQSIDRPLPPGRTALILGAEGPGLTADTIAAADLEVTIPTSDLVDSLNVGQAAAIAFQALARQNRSG